MHIQPIRAAELLQLWEYGQSQPPVRRALALLAASCPERSLSDLAALPIGRRDALLLRLRERTFGQRLAVTARCPQCGERLEMDLMARDLLSLDKTPAAVEQEEQVSLASDAHNPPLTVSTEGWRVAFRLPASQDLLALGPGEEEPRALLLVGCLLSVSKDEEPRSPGDLPQEVIANVLKAMMEADPLAEIRLALTCPACAHSWKPLLDPLAFFWEEIESWAGGILQEVHLLARAYGWREADILALSPWRRRAYLELVNG